MAFERAPIQQHPHDAREVAAGRKHPSVAGDPAEEASALIVDLATKEDAVDEFCRRHPG